MLHDYAHFYWRALSASTSEASFIITEILIPPKVSGSIYIFFECSCICLQDDSESCKEAKTDKKKDVKMGGEGCNIKAQACIIPQFYDKY